MSNEENKLEFLDKKTIRNRLVFLFVILAYCTGSIVEIAINKYLDTSSDPITVVIFYIVLGLIFGIASTLNADDEDE